MLNLVRRRKEKNIDRIRKMPVDELADTYNSITTYCPKVTENQVYCTDPDCKPCIVKWLESEAKDD